MRRYHEEVFAGGIDVLGSGRVATIAARLLARWQPALRTRLVSPRAAIDPDHLTRSRAPLVIATSIDEGRYLVGRTWSREALVRPNLRKILERLPPGALAGRLVIVVTNPVEPIVEVLARAEPAACVVGFGLSVDRARFREVLAHAPRLRLRAIAGTHAAGATAVLDAADCDPAVLVRRLAAHRSPFAVALPRPALDALATELADAPPRDRARAFVEGGARLLCDAERAGASPPAARGGWELARALARLVTGGRILVSTACGPTRLAIGAHGPELT